MVLRRLLLALCLMLSAGAASAGERFLGRDAASVVDETGRLTVSDLARGDGPAAFRDFAGRVPNHGVPRVPGSVLWLRIPIPDLSPGDGDRHALSLEETRVREARLYVPDAGGGFTEHVWRRSAAAPADEELRFPVFLLDAAAIGGRTVYLAAETASSMRAMVWLRTPAAFVASYGESGLFFGILIGALGGLSVYLVSLGIALRQTALGALGALAFAFTVYTAADRSLIETAILPGWAGLSRVLSLSATFAVFSAWIVFASRYLCIPGHHPRLARAADAVAVVLAVLAIDAAVEAAFDLRIVRMYSPYIGLAALAFGFGLAGVMLRREPWRAVAFLLCWSPAVAGGVARLGLDAVPGLDAAPAVVNAVFVGAGFSILVFGLVSSLDLQARERRLREAAEREETRFRDFARTASDSFWETDPDGRIGFAAGPASRALGLEPGVALASRLAGTVEGAGRQALATVERAFRLREPFMAVPLAAVAAAGAEPRHFLISGAPAADGTGWRGTVSDVTAERARLDREALQQKMAALGQLAGGMAHELNNLLHPIINLGRRLRDRPGATPDEARLAAIVVDAGQRAGEIVAGVLTTVRAGPITGRALPASEAVERSVEAIRPVVPAGVRLDAAIAPLDGPMLPPGEVLQVLSNLVANAVQAIAGGGRVAVTLAGEAGGALLAVSDDGEGMDAETRRRAIEPFFTTRPPSRGTGLGLAIVFGVVRGWGGSVEIQSEPGRGTTVLIRIPAGGAAPADPEES